jgi:PhzF family phenazine biosynthesis protein
MGATLACVDAFTSQPFRGNPAAVCLLDVAVGDDWMQALAAEMNLSETAFVLACDTGFDLRWFTPTTEVDLCGHATLASAHLLWESGRLPRGAPARFHTRSMGDLVATLDADGIALDLPAAVSSEVPEPRGLADALGAPLVAVARNDLHHLVELADARTVRNLRPDLGALRAVDVEAVTVTARSDDPAFHFVSRYFAPRYGIPEDPVTGAAHTSLGPWWAQRLGTTDLTALQCSPRGGTLRVLVLGDRVTLIGRAVTIWHGQLI